MKFTNTKKVLALLSFATLITAFVLYRAGVFDKYITPGDPSLQTSPNGGAMNNNMKDTLPSPKKDTTKEPRVMWSGSKSGRIITPGDLNPLHPDSTKHVDSSLRKKIDSIMISEGAKKTEIMPSTKSAPVFKPTQKKNDDNELLRIIKIYQGDSAGLRRALERYFKVRN